MTKDLLEELIRIAKEKYPSIEFINEEIVLRAELINLRYKLPMADSFIYATGQLNETLIWTQDADFQDLPGVKYIEARSTR